MNHVVYCTCGEVIVKSLLDDTKIRAKVLIMRGNAAFAVCKGCDQEVQVPLQLDNDMLKSMVDQQPTRHVPLYIRNVRKTS